MRKNNITRSLLKVEKGLTLFVAMLILVMLLGVIVLGFIYGSVLISLQPYSVLKDLQKSPAIYIGLSFGISFLLILTLLSSAFLLRKIREIKL